MGISKGRPPLPAPTDDPTDESVMLAGHMDDSATDVATNVSRRTDATSYTVPEDGRSITVPVGKTTNLLGHGRNKSQTSLLIEYFEASKSGNGNGRPSVRVKVTPSSKRKHKSGQNDAVQITELGKDRKQSYTRRISLGPKQDKASLPLEGTEISHSSGSNLSGHPPVEIEVLQNGSDLSNDQSRVSRDLHYTTNPSDISSMPPDSLLETTDLNGRSHSPLIEQEAKAAIDEHLSAPDDRDRARSISRERITQKVMEKLKQREAEKSIEYEPDTKPTKERRRRTSKSTFTNTESLSSANTPSQTSYRSGATSKVSLNNPRLLEMVEDTVRRLILPEIDQLKSQKRSQRKLQDSTDESVADSHEPYSGRRLSKSSTSPKFTSKPKVVLNRYDDQPGEVLSRGDSERQPERRRHRKSSRESVPNSERSERLSSKSQSHDSLLQDHDRNSHRLEDVAVASTLTAAALRHHDSGDLTDSKRHKTRSRTKSHDRPAHSAGLKDLAVEEKRKQDIPPMPFASAINESDVTRTSLLSEATERSESRRSDEYHTPLREVSRYSLNGESSPSSATPTQSRHRLRDPSVELNSPRSPASPQSISTKARIAALAAAGLSAAKFEQDRHEHPASDASSTKFHHDSLIPEGLSPRSKPPKPSRSSDRDSSRSPTTARDFGHRLNSPSLDQPFDDPGTPRAEDMEDWFQKQHEENNRYRRSIVGSSVDDSPRNISHARYIEHISNGDGSPDFDIRGVSAQPQIVYEPHDAESSVASLLEPSMMKNSISSLTGTPIIGKLGDIEQHNIADDSDRRASSEPRTSPVAEELDSPIRSRWSALREHAEALSAKTASHESGLIAMENDHSPSPHENRDVTQSASVKMVVSALPSSDDPMQEIGHGLDNVSEISTNPTEIQGTKPKGHKQRWSYDTDGFLKDHTQGRDNASPSSVRDAKAALLGGVGYALSGRDTGLVSPINVSHRASVEEQYNRGPTPDVHQAEAVYMGRPSASSQHGDEGYASAAQARTPGEVTPKTPHATEFTTKQLAEYEAAMAQYDDPFSGSGQEQAQNREAKAHGLTSSPYDVATSRVVDRIQSEDVVALMDHLTVRDAQRNARDTEILVTLVRSAAEMRQEFDALKKFIAEEDRLIMQNTDRDADLTVQKVLSGPRPMLGGVPLRSPRGNYDSEENVTKRKNIFKRALKGLSSRSNNDLGRIEDMLNQLLGDVEVLKGSQKIAGPPMSVRTGSMDSNDIYERRTVQDSGYEPEGRAGTSSTPNQSGGQLSPTPNKDKRFHSGYDGRRGSVNRVSTVAEDDEDDSTLDPHEARLLDDDRFEENPRLLTPTQESYNRDRSPDTPTQDSFKRDRELATDQLTPEKQSKHKSNSSSLFGIPKLSRWSKTTESTDPEAKRKSNQSYQTYDSKSGDSLNDEYHRNGPYTLKSDDRIRSTQSLVHEQNRETHSRHSSRSTLTRTPSPLMPSETSSLTHDHRREPLMSGGAGHISPAGELRKENLQRLAEYNDLNDEDAASLEDPKYQAHRNSLLLEHPQPRPGPTHRHQTNLETQARTFSGEMDVPSGLTDSDVSARTADSDFDPAQWGSNPAISLARTHKIASAAAPKDDGPLIPQVRPSARQQQQEREAAEAKRDEEEKEKNRPKHAYDRMYYSSPLGSGHLLEPIPEVRYSLETDSHSLRSAGQRSPDPSTRPSVATNGINTSSPARKITGPRPMGTRSANKETNVHDTVKNEGVRSGTVRRKPVAGSKARALDAEDENGWGTWKGKKQQ